MQTFVMDIDTKLGHNKMDKTCFQRKYIFSKNAENLRFELEY